MKQTDSNVPQKSVLQICNTLLWQLKMKDFIHTAVLILKELSVRQ